MALLRGKMLKRGLALGVGFGSLALLDWSFFGLGSARDIFFESAVRFVEVHGSLRSAGRVFEFFEWLGISYAGLMALSPAVLVGSAIKTYYTLPREATDKKTLLGGLGIAFAVFAVCVYYALVNATIGGHPLLSNQTSAASSLGRISRAEAAYVSAYGAGYSPTLAALGPPPGGAHPSASAAGLIDSLLANGIKSGYSFAYLPGPKDAEGHINTYRVAARPLLYYKSGTWSYFSDESRVIRRTSEDRPAAAKDPAIGS